MNRLPELTCGLIGSFLALLFSIFTFVIIKFITPFSSMTFISSEFKVISIVISILGLVLSLFIEKNAKIISIALISIGALLLMTNFLQLLPATLLIISGYLCLHRKVKKEPIINIKILK